MRKKITILILALFICVACVFALTACSGIEVNTYHNVAGKYYLYRDGEYDMTDYIAFLNKKWTNADDIGYNEFSLSGENITLFMEIFGHKVEYASGTVKNGVLTLDISGQTFIYYKMGKAPSDGDASNNPNPSITTKFTVTYNGNGGTFSSGQTILEQTDVTPNTTLTAPKSPFRTGFTFGGWSVSKSDGEIWKFAIDKVTTDITLYAVWQKASEGLAYTFNDNGKSSYSVTGIGTCTDTDIVIPTAHDDLPVTSIGDWAFEGCNSLTSITISDSVTSIGEGAFFNCHSLTSVTIPDSVTSIGIRTFYNCSSLTSITIPDSVSSIGSSAFEGCSKLTYNIKNNLKYLGNSNNPYLCLIDTMSNDITSATIDNNCKVIGSGAFKGCSSLASITIPDSVTSIGGYAFCGCSSLTSITIGKSVTSIGNAAFKGCSSLKHVTYKGTKIQWETITRGSYWAADTGDFTIHCTDGDI